MAAAPIKTRTVKIKYVNQPKDGKTRGSIKGTNDEFFGVHVSKLTMFEVGMTYDVSYTEDGEWRTVVSATLIEPERKPEPESHPEHRAAASRPAAIPSGETNRQTHPIDAERMWVCSLMNAAITARVLNPLDLKAMGEATMNFKRLWTYAFVANQSEPARTRAAAGE